MSNVFFIFLVSLFGLFSQTFEESFTLGAIPDSAWVLQFKEDGTYEYYHWNGWGGTGGSSYK